MWLHSFSELSTFREWIRYRYGTFAESGFENDPLYPLMYQYGAEEKSSQSCGNLTQNDFSGDQMVDASIEQFHKVSTSVWEPECIQCEPILFMIYRRIFDFHTDIFFHRYFLESRYFKQVLVIFNRVFLGRSLLIDERIESHKTTQAICNFHSVFCFTHYMRKLYVFQFQRTS